MKRIALGLLLLCALSAAAGAACPSPLVVKDGNGSSQNFASTNDGSNNCVGNVQVNDGTNKAPVPANAAGASTSNPGLQVYDPQLHADLTAALPSGTNGIGTVNPTTLANWGLVATGAAPPANAAYLGANASGATGGHVAGLIQCDSHVFKHITSATDTLAVQGVASQTVYVCGWRSRAAGVATWFLENTASANANCSSSNTQITGVATEAANTGETMLAQFWTGLKNTSGNGLCINSTGTGGVDVDIWYTQF